jgi:uncharacterized membrane protein
MKWLAVMVGIAYPLLVLLGLKWFDARVVGIVVLLVVGWRVMLVAQSSGRPRRLFFVPALFLLALWLALTVALDDRRGLFLMPALINAGLLVVFAGSLFRPPSIVEHLARLRGAVLSPEVSAYCRSVTRVWCVFFVLNGGVIVWLACAGTPEWWGFYTGILSYVLIALLFGVEFVYRHYRFRHYVGSAVDPLLKRIFPPRETS